jgi:uncharacterized membrane protein
VLDGALHRLPCRAADARPGFAQPPKGVVLETPEQIGQNAAKIAETGRQQVHADRQPDADDRPERAVVAAWFAQGAKR